MRRILRQTGQCQSGLQSHALTASQSPAGLYIHFPFCRSKCIYCDFYSITDTSGIDPWLHAIEQEAILYRGLFPHYDSLYIGGGTPSLLGHAQMASLFGLLNRYFTFLPEAEITVEINPDDAGIGLFRVLKDGGVNRLSFGVQAFDDRQLTFLRRRHSAAAAERAIVTAREEGFDNVAIDLIYGVPGQTKRSWLATLEKALSFGPKHLSCYQLTTEGETPLSRMIGNGIVRPLGEEKARSLFLDTSRLLESRGFLHYEVSNYAASQEYFCRHNQKYWTHVPYLGLGPAAHSFDGKGRWWNHRSFKRYSSFVKRGEKPVEGDELLSGDQLKLERLYLGLRTSRGISIDDLPETARPALQQLKKERLVTVNGRSVQPSRLGYLVADSLPVLLS